LILNETDDRFYIGKSTIEGAGDGLFARAALSPGDRLAAIGVLVEPDSITDRCTRYADEYKLRFGGKLLVPFGYVAMVNHADEPNLEKQLDGDTPYMAVTRPVEAGEELFFAYSDYARERYGIG
jgi:hypothetical protein